MKLKDYDWNAQLEVEVEYPDHIIQGFMNYLRLHKHWHEDPELVYGRFLVLQRDLTDARNDAALEAAKVCDPDCKIPTRHEGECYTGPTTFLPGEVPPVVEAAGTVA